jgi:hypothetical protein
MKTAATNSLHVIILAFAWVLSGSPLANAQNGVGINSASPKSDFEVNGSFGLAVTTITADTTLDSTTKSLVLCNNGATNIMVTLPTVANCLGRMYTIKKGTSSTGSVHIMGTSSQTIDGNTAYMLTSNDESVTVFSTGTEWKTIGKSNQPFPMGEINYFNTTGTTINITAQSNGSTNMIACAPATSLSSGAMEFVQLANGQLQYTGDRPKHFHIACTISMLAAGTQTDTFVFGLAKGTPGTPDTVTMLTASKVLQKFNDASTSTALHVAITMNKNDYLQLYAGNTTSTTRDVKVQTLTLFALGMD